MVKAKKPAKSGTPKKRDSAGRKQKPAPYETVRRMLEELRPDLVAQAAVAIGKQTGLGGLSCAAPPGDARRYRVSGASGIPVIEVEIRPGAWVAG